MDSELVKSISADIFDDLTFESIIPTVIFFTAERCNVCKSLYPVIEEIAVDYNEKLKIFSVDVDKNKSLAKRFKLRSIPTLLIFKHGEVMERISGFQPKELLQIQIERILNIV